MPICHLPSLQKALAWPLMKQLPWRSKRAFLLSSQLLRHCRKGNQYLEYAISVAKPQFTKLNWSDLSCLWAPQFVSSWLLLDLPTEKSRMIFNPGTLMEASACKKLIKNRNIWSRPHPILQLRCVHTSPCPQLLPSPLPLKKIYVAI